MDTSSNRGKIHSWNQPKVIQPKTQIKLNVDPPVSSPYNQTLPAYGINESLKRSLSDSNNHRVHFKKRPFTPQIVTPGQTDDDDEDDDDDDDSNSGNHSMKPNGAKRDDNRRRAAHTAAEQKRRNAIRRGYDALQGLVPNSHLLDPISSQKVSKAAILKRSTDYLVQLTEEKRRLAQQLEENQREAFCLSAVLKTYEDILETNINSTKNGRALIDEEAKFQVNLGDKLFASFDQAIQNGQITDFRLFTSAMFRWVEDSCRPSDINDIVARAVTHLKS